MKGGPKQQVTTTMPDKATQAWNEKVRNRAGQVADEGYTTYGGNRVANADPISNSATAGMNGMGQNFLNLGDRATGMHFGGDLSPYDQAGATGARALGGDSAAISSLMNPYQKNVVDAMGKEYDQMRGKSVMDVNNIATAGGAFGGSRQAVMQGERMGALDRAQGSEIASLLHGGYTDAMNQAGTAANVGLNAGQQRLAGQGLQLDANGQAIQAGQGAMDAYGRQFGMGDYYRGLNQDQINSQIDKFNERRGWGERGLNIMTGAGNGMQTGQTTSQPLYKNRLNSMAGGAMAGAGIGGPIGGAIGAGAGLLFG